MEKGKIGVLEWNSARHIKTHTDPRGRVQTHHCGHRTVKVSGAEYLYDTFTTHPYGDETKFLGSDVYVYRVRRRLQSGRMEVEYLGRLPDMQRDIEYAILEDTFRI